MKKLIVLLLTALMVFSLAACGGKEESNTGEVPTITLDMSTLFIVPSLEATQKVEDQLNDYLLNTLHEDFKVHLVITAIGDYFSKIPMELASGGDDAPDVVQVFAVSDWANQGYILPLDDYLGNDLYDASLLRYCS